MLKLTRIVGAVLALSFLLVALPAAPASAAVGTITTVSPGSGPVGSVINLIGTGYTASSIPVIQWGTVLAQIPATGSVNATGHLTASFVVPSGSPRGQYPFSVTTSAGDTTTATWYFTVTPQVQLSATSGYVGDQITVSGSGFAASSAVAIYLDASSTLTTTSNSLGQISTVFTVPRAQWGVHSIRGSDAIGDSSIAVFTVSQKLSASPAEASVGTLLTVSGTGYYSAQTVTVYFDDVQVGVAAADSTGSFALANFVMPPGGSGTHTIRAQDASGNSSSVSVNTVQSLSISPSIGPVGTKVAVVGSGFRPAQAVTLSIDDSALTLTIATDDKGGFNSSIDIPAASTGPHSVKASDTFNSSSRPFVVSPSASLSTTGGPVGSKVNVTGSGFESGASISVLFDNAPAKTTVADGKGSFAATIDVPPRSFGAYKIRVTDGTSSVDLNFSITTNVSINPQTSAQSPGFVGSPITLSGVGFKPGASLTVTYDGKTVPSSGTVGSDSNFSVTFTAPVSKAGQHTVTVSDGVSNLPLTFFVEATPPPAPALNEPPTGASQKADGKFTWGSVSDPSGVVYTLQIGSSSVFQAGSVVMERTGLNSPVYTLTPEDRLQPANKNKPYYWRVRAIDGASNEGQWSNIRSFTVGSPFPAWATWTFVALGAVTMALFAFWLGRRSKSSSASGRLSSQDTPK